MRSPAATAALRTVRRSVVLAVSAATAVSLAAGGSSASDTAVTGDEASGARAAEPRAVELTTVSRDPYTNPAAYHRTEVEPDTFAWGDTVVAVFQTGRYPNGGSTNTGYATTLNGGKTWRHGFLPATTVDADPPGPYARLSDPTIAYDPKHDVWLANSLALANVNSLIVNRSTDGGRTFGKPILVSEPAPGQGYDKNWIVCDTWAQSPGYGNCYVQVDDFMSGNTMLMFRSTDGGKSWQEADVAPASGLGGQPVVQPDGTVVVPYSANLTAIQSLVSTDGGKTYDGPYPVSSTTDHVVSFMRTPPLPTAEVAGDGTVYVSWQDCRFRDGCAANDIVISSSEDGTSWSKVKRVPIDGVGSGVDHFVPGLGVDSSTDGASTRLALTYYYFTDADCTFDDCRLYAGFVSSTDAGENWSKPKRVLGPIKLKSLPDAGGRFVGDYISTSIVGDRAFPVLANATKGNCTLDVRSCAEHMVAPSKGLAIRGGGIPADTDVPVAGVRSDRVVPGPPRAY